MPDWRDALLAETARVPLPAQLVPGRNPIRWAGYTPRRSVTLHVGPITGHRTVAAVWDFATYGGSFGEDDATALAAAVELAEREPAPLLTFLRSGGTRLQEGVAALVGIPRARLALRRLAAAGLPHVAVCDMPTTGGIWISVGASADVRAGVTGATVGFVGPRVVEAITGRPVPPGSFTAEAAYAGGRLDALLAGDEVGGWLARVLDALAPGTRAAGGGPAGGGPAGGGGAGGGGAGGPAETATPPVELPERTGAEQVRAARARRTSGSALLYALFPNAVDLRAGHRDTTVRAVVGRLAEDGAPVVGVALAAEHDGRPTVDGYALLTRAATLADRVGIRLLTLVDTPGAEPDARSEADGIAPAIATALDAVLTCRAPTVALVHGEGGSGGAMDAAVTDVVLVTPDAYFSALGPEGAAAALRIPPAEAAERMRVVPRDLLALGFADAAVPPPDSAHPETLRRLLGAHFARLGALPDAERRGQRRQRWSAALPGRL